MDELINNTSVIENILRKNNSILSIKTIAKRGDLSKRKTKRILRYLESNDLVRNVSFNEIGSGKSCLNKSSHLWQLK